MAKVKKILVLDAGYIGRHLFAKLGPARAVVTYYRTPIENGLYFDALSMNLSEIIETPEMFSHAAVLYGETKPDVVAADKLKSRALNVESIKSVLQYLHYWGIKPIFTSSESVFDGTIGSHVESDPVNPILTYGQQKVEIERYIQDVFEQFIIVRFGKVFGSQRGDGTLFTNWLDDIERSETIYCAYDQVFSPIYIQDVVEGIIRLIEMDCNGLFHVSNHKAYSRLELFNILHACLSSHSLVDSNAVPCSIRDFDLLEERPLNISMRPDKVVRATGLRISEVEEVCPIIVRNWLQGQGPDSIRVQPNGVGAL